jgi:hypothetical protein
MPQAARGGSWAPLSAHRSAFAGAAAPLLAPGGARRGAFGRPSGGGARAAKGSKRGDKGGTSPDDVPMSKDPRVRARERRARAKAPECGRRTLAAAAL